MTTAIGQSNSLPKARISISPPQIAVFCSSAQYESISLTLWADSSNKNGLYVSGSDRIEFAANDRRSAIDFVILCRCDN